MTQEGNPPMGFTQALKKQGEIVWNEIRRHPFIQGLGDGSVPLEAFRFYMAQDYVFLVEYARVLALAVTKGGGLETMGRFAGLLDATLNQEMELHRSYAERFGISAQELESAKLAPTAYAYTRHLLEAAHSGGLPEVAAALMPCQWGYAELGAMLEREGDVTEANPYADWIKTYSSEDFQEIARWLCGLLDDLAGGLPNDRKQSLTEIFLTSSRYEYLFWDMSNRLESWPV